MRRTCAKTSPDRSFRPTADKTSLLSVEATTAPGITSSGETLYVGHVSEFVPPGFDALPGGDDDARALSWVRASHAELDVPLWRAVGEWLAAAWPFGNVEYTPRVED